MSNLNFVVSVIINDSKDPLKLMFNKSDKIQQIFENHHIKTMLENNDLKSLKIFNAQKKTIRLTDNIDVLTVKDINQSLIYIVGPNKIDESKIPPDNFQSILGTRVSSSQVSQNRTEGKLDKVVETIKRVFSCIQVGNYDKVLKLKGKDNINNQLITCFCGFVELVVKKDEKIKQQLQQIKELHDNAARFKEITEEYQNLRQQDKRKRLQILIKQKQQNDQYQKQLEQKNQSIKNLEDKIKEKNRLIKNLEDKIKEQNQLIKNLEDKIKEQKQSKEQYIARFKKVRQQLNQMENIQKEAEIKKKKFQINKFISEKKLIDKNSMLLHLGANSQLSLKFIEQVQKYIGRQIKQVRSQFRYDSSQRQNFHKSIYQKPNILLIAKTVEGKIFGGFSQYSFTTAQPAQQKKAKLKGFLFNFEKSKINGQTEKMNLFKLRAGCSSNTYCPDYLIFGEEEISIQKYSKTAFSIFVLGTNNYLCYDDPDQKRQYFLSDERKNTVELEGYQLVTIDFK